MIASLSSSSVRYARLALLAVVLLVPVLSPVLRADILVDVYPTLAPNRFGSPSYNTWVTNTTTALQNGNSSGGTAGTPSFYQQIATGSTLPTTAIVVTDFPSWLGSANPVGTYGAAFGGELGNRLLFSLTLRGTAGTTFSISQLSFVATSSDPGNIFGFTNAAGVYQYGLDYVGINYGADHLPGGSGVNADTIITSGLNTQLVDVIFGRGSGSAFQALSSDPGATNQDRINNAALGAGAGNFTFTGTYTINGFAGSSFENFNPVPEPGVNAALLAAALVAAGFFAARRRRLQPARVIARSAHRRE